MNLENLQRRIRKWAKSKQGQADMDACVRAIAAAEREITEQSRVFDESMRRRVQPIDLTGI